MPATVCPYSPRPRTKNLEGGLRFACAFLDYQVQYSLLPAVHSAVHSSLVSIQEKALRGEWC